VYNINIISTATSYSTMEKYTTVTMPSYIKRIKIDIGLSYNAPQSQVWLENNPDLFVFGFEPNPDCLDILQKGNIQLKHPAHSAAVKDEYLKTRYCIVPVALNNVTEPTQMDFYKMQNDCGTSSLYNPIDPFIGAVKEVVSVPVYSLKHFFDVFPWHKFEYIEYIKIDAQGCDYNILVSAGDYLKERVVYITAEPESAQYANCQHNNAENMSAYMESQGFERIHHPNTHDPTYINRKFMHLKEHIFIYQRG
jgi:FkbM family methyltransferase